MNVLFVGKWDIVGAYLADRFLKEGNQVCWMTDEGSDRLWHRKYKGKIYRGTWKREDYLNIMKSNSVNLVVFMTGGLREQYEECADYESQMLSLTNLLNVLRTYPLRNLIYLSSLELDYEEIHTPVLTELAAGEMLCEAYHKAYGMPYMIARMGCVYGSFRTDAMGLIGKVLTDLRENRNLVSCFGTDDYVDVINGADAAEAIYRLVNGSAHGLHRVSSGQPMTLSELYEIVGSVLTVKPDVTWLNQKKTISREFFEMSSVLEEELGWSASISFREKGSAYLQTAISSDEERELKTTRKGITYYIKKIGQMQAVRRTIETVIMFAFCEFLLHLSSDISDFKYIDFRMMFITILSAMHGMKVGILAVFLASCSYANSLISTNIDISYLLYSIDTWLPFAVYVISGSLIGYVAEKRKDEKESMEDQLSLLMDKYEFLKSIHGETIEIKGNLQRQIINSKHSFGNAYEVAVELDSLKPEMIILKVIHILESIMECPKAAVFLINNNNMGFARLKACSRLLRNQLSNSINMKDYESVMESFGEEGFFVNKELLDNYPDYAAPIYYKNQIFGFCALYDIGTDKFTIYYQNLFKIITSLIEKNLVKAMEYENAIREDLYYPGTELLYPAILEERLRIMKEASEDIAYSYVVGRVYPMQLMDQKETAERIASVIRGNDSMGVDQDGNYVVILVSMTMDYIDGVAERFAKKGLKLEVE